MEWKWSNQRSNYSWYYSGSNKTGQAGTGFIVTNRTFKYILGFETYYERICKLRIKGKYNTITLINVYAPTEDTTDEDKEQFYEDLQSVVNKVPKSDIAILLGDLNAKPGKERVCSNVTGKHTLRDETNRYGEMLCEFWFANNMTIMSTQFQHRQIHKATWISPDQTTATQIRI